MNQMAVNPQMGGPLANIFGMQSQPIQYQARPMMPNFMSTFMPVIPGYQPNYRPNLPQTAYVVRGGTVQGIVPVNTYPQYQNQARPVFGPNQAVPVPGVQYNANGVQQMLRPPAMNQSNPIAMMNMGGNMQPNNLLNGFGFMNQNNRSRRF